MSRDQDNCKVAMDALQEICGVNITPDDLSEANTIWVEVIVEQGREVGRDDISDMTDWLTEVVERHFQEETIDDPVVSTTDTRRELVADALDAFVVDGTERVDDEDQSVSTGQSHLHGFIKFKNMSANVRWLTLAEERIRDAFQDSPLGVGRGFHSVRVVDPAIVQRTAPQRAGPPREDVEIID